MITAIDTNALLALLYDDDYADTSEAELRRAYQDGRVVITSVVYAELAADGHFETPSELTQFLKDFSIQLVEPSKEALFRAGQQFQRYTERRSDGLQCPSCGTKQTVICEEVQHVVVVRIDRPMDESNVAITELVAGPLLAEVHRFGIVDTDLSHQRFNLALDARGGDAGVERVTEVVLEVVQ